MVVATETIEQNLPTDSRKSTKMYMYDSMQFCVLLRTGTAPTVSMILQCLYTEYLSTIIIPNSLGPLFF